MDFPRLRTFYFSLSLAVLIHAGPVLAVDYQIVDTHQSQCYDTLQAISFPNPGEPFYGQDAQYLGTAPAYQLNGDSTVTDLSTGLMWIQPRGVKVSWDSAVLGASTCRIGGYSDWRMPTIKELYSLIDFTGYSGTSAYTSKPYIDTVYFGFKYGDTLGGERWIDCQDWSGTKYAGLTMMGDTTYFGVNFADGRIKGYGQFFPPNSQTRKKLYVRYVRGNPDYGVNHFIDNGDSTILDQATGLTWSRFDSRAGMKWREALAWVQAKNAENYCGRSDWRLPNAKELQGIVDYTRAPQAIDPGRRGPAIDTSFFRISARGDGEYPYFWTGTTHVDGPAGNQCSKAVYVTFGRALGWMEIPPNSGNWLLLDVHGAGSQRSDPKFGDTLDYPHGNGPQGDVIWIYNYVRLVRGGLNGQSEGAPATTKPTLRINRVFPNPFRTGTAIVFQTAGTSPLRLKVYDAAGQAVRTLWDGPAAAGIHWAPWDGTDDRGSRVGPGVYFARLEGGAERAAGKVILCK